MIEAPPPVLKYPMTTTTANSQWIFKTTGHDVSGLIFAWGNGSEIPGGLACLKFAVHLAGPDQRQRLLDQMLDAVFLRLTPNHQDRCLVFDQETLLGLAFVFQCVNHPDDMARSLVRLSDITSASADFCLSRWFLCNGEFSFDPLTPSRSVLLSWLASNRSSAVSAVSVVTILAARAPIQTGEVIRRLGQPGAALLLSDAAEHPSKRIRSHQEDRLIQRLLEQLDDDQALRLLREAPVVLTLGVDRLQVLHDRSVLKTCAARPDAAAPVRTL